MYDQPQPKRYKLQFSLGGIGSVFAIITDTVIEQSQIVEPFGHESVNEFIHRVYNEENWENWFN